MTTRISRPHQARREEANIRLADLQNASKINGEDVKTGVEKAWLDVKNVFHKIGNRISQQASPHYWRLRASVAKHRFQADIKSWTVPAMEDFGCPCIYCPTGINRPSGIAGSAARREGPDRAAVAAGAQVASGPPEGAASEWSQDKRPRLAAALSYYTIFSIAPRHHRHFRAGSGRRGGGFRPDLWPDPRGMMKKPGAQAIQTMVEGAQGYTGHHRHRDRRGDFAPAFRCHRAARRPQHHLEAAETEQGVMVPAHAPALAFSMVLVIAFMLLVTLAERRPQRRRASPGTVRALPAAALQALNLGLSFAFIAVLFSLIYKVLPDEIRWRDVWIGGVVTAFLFTIGKFLIGLYLGQASCPRRSGRRDPGSSSCSGCITPPRSRSFGAEFTQVHATILHVSRIRPTPNAEPVPGAGEGRDIKPQHTRRQPMGLDIFKGKRDTAGRASFTWRDMVRVPNGVDDASPGSGSS